MVSSNIIKQYLPFEDKSKSNGDGNLSLNRVSSAFNVSVTVKVAGVVQEVRRSASMASQSAPRPIRRILIANRGEIAIRLLQACRELPSFSGDGSRIETFALYTTNDNTHISLGRPDHAIELPSPASYLNIDHLVKIVKQHDIDAVHPGYGFLSESAEFSRRVYEDTGGKCFVIGPGPDVLEMTGDKLAARRLARDCEVPILEALGQTTNSTDEVRAFAAKVGYPVMIKAVDGGGGRGIRLVESEDALQNAVDRCISESPSHRIFAEQAAVQGYKHIEIQIVGYGNGQVKHLWERDCSVQRRFQKIVEVAPTQQEALTKDDALGQARDAAIRMARRLNYIGLGTWEFLVNFQEQKYFFLEINPRLQVEHTITECIAGFDLVREQLMIAQGLLAGEGTEHHAQRIPIRSQHKGKTSIQLRLCAEDPNANFALSIGRITEVSFPSGNGVRVDSHLSKGGSVGSDFDNLLAKIIVTAPDWPSTIRKAQRALEDTRIVGVKTNLDLLRAIVVDPVFQSRNYDTRWLESNLPRLVSEGNRRGRSLEQAFSFLPSLPYTSSQTQAPSVGSSSGVLFRKGDSWTISLSDPSDTSTTPSTPQPSHHLTISRLIRNEFPTSLAADITYTIPNSRPQTYRAAIASSSPSASSTSSTQHRRGDPNDKSHIVLPMSGKLMEVLVDEGDVIEENQVLAFVKQMKMELEVRSPRRGRVRWALDMDEGGGEEGLDVAEGTLLLELESPGQEGDGEERPRSKL